MDQGICKSNCYYTHPLQSSLNINCLRTLSYNHGICTQSLCPPEAIAAIGVGVQVIGLRRCVRGLGSGTRLNKSLGNSPKYRRTLRAWRELWRSRGLFTGIRMSSGGRNRLFVYQAPESDCGWSQGAKRKWVVLYPMNCSRNCWASFLVFDPHSSEGSVMLFKTQCRTSTCIRLIHRYLEWRSRSTCRSRLILTNLPLPLRQACTATSDV